MAFDISFQRLAQTALPKRLPAPAPVGKPSLRQVERRTRRLLRLLVERDEREQNLAVRALWREQDPIDHAIPIDPDFPDLRFQVPGRSQPTLANVEHPGGDRRRVPIAHAVDELCDGTTTGSRPVVTPSALVRGLRFGRHRSKLWAT